MNLQANHEHNPRHRGIGCRRPLTQKPAWLTTAQTVEALGIGHDAVRSAGWHGTLESLQIASRLGESKIQRDRLGGAAIS